MMADFVLSQGMSFLAFFILGGCMAALFDLFRIFRRIISHSHLAVALEDLCFWVISGILTFSLLFHFQTGRLRIFLPVSVFLGIGFWIVSFSRLFMGPFLRFLLWIKEKVRKL